jgi:recombination protein RecA
MGLKMPSGFNPFDEVDAVVGVVVEQPVNSTVSYAEVPPFKTSSVVQSIAPEVKTTPPAQVVVIKSPAMAKADAMIAKKNAPPPGPPKLLVGVNLAQIMAATEKKKGEGIFIIARDVPNPERIGTGIFELDLAMGGGFPKGRYSIIFGPESGCKTTVALLAIATAQRLPPPCNKAVFIDAEHAFDPTWAARLGVNIDELVVVKPGYGEEAGDLFEAVLGADDVAIVVFDSLAMMVSTKEADQSLENFDVGTASLLVKRMVNKGILALSAEAKKKHYPCILFINQIRFKIGVMFGNPETTPGGKAKDFASSMTLRCSASNKIVKTVNPDIHSFKEMTVKVTKSKVPVTKAVVEFDLCVLEHDGMACGESKSWNAVESALKQMGELHKATGPGAKGWMLLGKNYPILDVIQSVYESDVEFKMLLQKMVIDSYKGETMLIGNPE